MMKVILNANTNNVISELHIEAVIALLSNSQNCIHSR